MDGSSVGDQTLAAPAAAAGTVGLFAATGTASQAGRAAAAGAACYMQQCVNLLYDDGTFGS